MVSGYRSFQKMNNRNRLNYSPRLRQKITRNIGKGALLLSMILVGIYVNQQELSQQSAKQAQKQESAQKQNTEQGVQSQSSALSNQTATSAAENQKESAAESQKSSTRTSKNNSSQASQMASMVEYAATAFTVESKAGKISWTTRMEKNTDHFEVMKSLDGISFEKIQEVRAAGAGEHQFQEYSGTDNQLKWNELPRVFYQINTVGKDGKSHSSEVIEHDFDLNLGMYMKVGDASGEELTVRYVADRAMSCDFEILDMNGKLITQSGLEASPVISTLILDISDLKAGTYFFRLKNQLNSITEIVKIEE